MSPKLKKKLLYIGIAIVIIAALNVVFQPYLEKLPLPWEKGGEVACTPADREKSDRMVVLRVDDIQAYAWRETSMRMIEDAENNGIPLTLGVIPAGLSADSELVAFLKEHRCHHEFALHGWNHAGGEGGDQPEFRDLTKQEAYDRIVPGIAMLHEIVDDPIVTWIPPLNVHSKGTEEALRELGFVYLSTEG
jgi:predicted deacetylase